jgi:uncharacterized RDD family membrane protein YckC
MRARPDIRTPPAAGFVSRLFAFSIDIAFIVSATHAAAWFVRTLETLFRRYARIDYAALVAAGLPLITALYNIGCWTLTGRTPGKWIMGLRVVRRDGRRVTLNQATLRLFGYVLSALPLYAGFLWVLVDPRRRAWHDRLAGTRVIYDPR